MKRPMHNEVIYEQPCKTEEALILVKPSLVIGDLE